MIWRMGVPVATPITLRDWLAAPPALLRREAWRGSFETEVSNLLKVDFVRAPNSGRAALFLALRAMKRMSGREEVVIPAFVCPSVGRAVVKAGLKPILCDVGPTGSGLDPVDLERVLSSGTLAVVAAHLYGYPTDIGSILKLSHA